MPQIRLKKPICLASPEITTSLPGKTWSKRLQIKVLNSRENLKIKIYAFETTSFQNFPHGSQKPWLHNKCPDWLPYLVRQNNYCAFKPGVRLRILSFAEILDELA